MSKEQSHAPDTSALDGLVTANRLKDAQSNQPQQHSAASGGNVPVKEQIGVGGEMMPFDPNTSSLTIFNGEDMTSAFAAVTADGIFNHTVELSEAFAPASGISQVGALKPLSGAGNMQIAGVAETFNAHAPSQQLAPESKGIGG